MEICREDYITRLKLLPVCNCGYVFRDGVIAHEKVHTMSNGAKIPYRYIEPSICPNCKKSIECIEYFDDIEKYIKEGF